MSNILIDYLNKRVEQSKPENSLPGPVITISREYGANVDEIAEMLSKKLSERTKNQWSFLTKEILEDSAKKLNVNEREIAHIFGADEKHFLGDFVVSFSGKNYKTDSTIKKTITTVVKNYAELGNCVIVGRAGCIIAKSIEKSLHIRIIAPINYRIESIAQRMNLSIEEAKKLVAETEKKRDTFMGFFKGNLPDNEIYDAIFNRGKLQTETIVDSIINLAELKKIL